MASAQRRSGTRGRPPPKRWRFSRTGMSGSSTVQSASETRKAVVVRLLGVRTRVRLVDVVSFMLWSIPGYSDRLLAHGRALHLIAWVHYRIPGVTRSPRV